MVLALLDLVIYLLQLALALLDLVLYLLQSALSDLALLNLVLYLIQLALCSTLSDAIFVIVGFMLYSICCCISCSWLYALLFWHNADEDIPYCQLFDRCLVCIEGSIYYFFGLICWILVSLCRFLSGLCWFGFGVRFLCRKFREIFGSFCSLCRLYILYCRNKRWVDGRKFYVCIFWLMKNRQIKY